jgi:hypothetical protein
MTLNFHKKPQRDFVFHFFLKFLLFLIYFIFFALYFFFQHADVHATACWRIGSYAPASAWYARDFTSGFDISKFLFKYPRDLFVLINIHELSTSSQRSSADNIIILLEIAM